MTKTTPFPPEPGPQCREHPTATTATAHTDPFEGSSNERRTTTDRTRRSETLETVADWLRSRETYVDGC